MSAPVAIVTGAGQGVGRATAELLAREGYVVVAGVRDLERARHDYGHQPGIHLARLDVTQPDDVAAAVALAEGLAGGAVDVLVNNAGHAMMAAQEDGDIDAARAMFEVNVWGAARMVQAVVPGMRAARRGTVVTVSSIGARITWPLVAFYHASKYALSALVEGLAFEVAPFGIRVGMIEPGMIDTEFSRATVVSGQVTDPESEYAHLFQGLRGGFGAWRQRDDTSSAGDCARAVWDIISSDDPPIRMPVGGDAELLDGVIRGATDDLVLHDHIREFLGVDWPRVPPAPRP